MAAMIGRTDIGMTGRRVTALTLCSDRIAADPDVEVAAVVGWVVVRCGR
jgi:hypothetical protein